MICCGFNNLAAWLISWRLILLVGLWLWPLFSYHPLEDGVPNHWDTAHYWTMAYLEVKHMSSWPEHVHSSTCVSGEMVGIHAYMCQPATSPSWAMYVRASPPLVQGLLCVCMHALVCHLHRPVLLPPSQATKPQRLVTTALNLWLRPIICNFIVSSWLSVLSINYFQLRLILWLL